VVVRKVPFNRLKQQLIGLACELRPALADHDASLSLFDCVHRA
jgi:hypothetical protein